MVLGLLEHVTPSNFFRRILRSEALVYKSYFFRRAVLRKLFDIRFSHNHCNFSRVSLLAKMASKTVTRSITSFTHGQKCSCRRLILSAEILASNKSTFCRSVSRAFSFVLAPVELWSRYDQTANFIIYDFLGGIFVHIVVRLEKVGPIHTHLATLCSRRQETLSMPKYSLR